MSFRRIFLAVCSVTLVSMEAPVQAQSVLTRHVRQAVRGSQARQLGLLPATQSLRLDIVLKPCAIRQGSINSCRKSAILPARPTAISSLCRSLQRALVPARKITIP